MRSVSNVDYRYFIIEHFVYIDIRFDASEPRRKISIFSSFKSSFESTGFIWMHSKFKWPLPQGLNVEIDGITKVRIWALIGHCLLLFPTDFWMTRCTVMLKRCIHKRYERFRWTDSWQLTGKSDATEQSVARSPTLLNPQSLCI